MTAIYKRELKSLFSGMIAPVFMAFLLLMAGIYTCSVNFGAGYPEFERVISGISFIFLIIVPILTMRSFSEERAARTDQLLYTLPIRTSAVVAGKYLAMVTVLGISTLILCLYPLILSVYGRCVFRHRICVDIRILPRRMRPYCDRNVHILPHRKPGDLGGPHARRVHTPLPYEQYQRDDPRFDRRILCALHSPVHCGSAAHLCHDQECGNIRRGRHGSRGRRKHRLCREIVSV